MRHSKLLYYFSEVAKAGTVSSDKNEYIDACQVLYYESIIWKVGKEGS